MFKQSNSLENFERLINDKKNNVTNLDLNNDGEIDYINVHDIKEGNTHVIVISTYLNDTEKQDIATISIEKTGETEAVLQIEGDKDLYAENTIIEPTEEKETIKKTDGGPSSPIIEIQSLLVNVWFWPCVSYIYAPNYIVWASPYRWGFRAYWWRPWHPFLYSTFYVRCAPHRLYYHSASIRRIAMARNMYTPVRHSSALVIHNNSRTTAARSHNVKSIIIRNASFRRVPSGNLKVKKIKVRNAPLRKTAIKIRPMR